MKHLLQQINGFFYKLFGKSLSYLKAHSEAAVMVTTRLKTYVESPIADVAVNVIPGGIDDVILSKLRQVLPIVTQEVAIANGILKASKNPNDAMAKVIEHLKSLNKEARVGFWLTFSAQLNKALSDNKVTFSEAVILAQMAYKELYEKK